MGWSSVIGQSRVIAFVRAALEQRRMAHAYLFTGPRGVGKYAAALELAKVLNCEKSPSEPCDKCTSCLQANNLQHPNISLIFALPVGRNEKNGDPPLAKLSDGDLEALHEQLRLKSINQYHEIRIEKANNIKINSIRNIRREASMTQYKRGQRVFIILDAENMSEEASNALLKTLEEPNDHTTFILTSARPELLLPTIISRCQSVRFDFLSVRDIKDALVERCGIEPAKALAIAEMSHGSYSRALEFCDSKLPELQEYAVEFLRTMLFKSRREVVLGIESISEKYRRDEVAELLQLIQLWLHDAMIIRERADISLEEESQAKLKKFNSSYPSWDYAAAVESLNEAISLLEKNVYIPLILHGLIISLRKAVRSSGSL
jgi:DNA polymerase III subunit delta'